MQPMAAEPSAGIAQISAKLVYINIMSLGNKILENPDATEMVWKPENQIGQ